jgi:hypothetical protein
MRKVALFLAILFSLLVSAQDPGYLEFAGRCIKDNAPLKGANVSVYKGSTKVTELTTGKNGKFQFFLDFKGTDYKVVFSYPGCPDMYMMIYSSKVQIDKEVFPIYDIDVIFFDYGKPTINYASFKDPFMKVEYDGKKTFRDNEIYRDEFLKNLYIDPEEVKRKEEQLALEKHQKELEAKMKLEADEKLRQEQLAEAQRKAQEEADRLKKQLEEKARLEKNEAHNVVTSKEADSKESMVSKEMELTIEKEKRTVKEKQNKAIRATYENDLLKIVATNERKTKVAEFVKKRDDATRNEVIETLKKEAETKAMSEQIMFDSKVRNKQAIMNSRVRNQEMLILIKQTAFNDMRMHYVSTKKFPEAKTYKPPGLAAITTDLEQTTFKTIYTVTLTSGMTKTIYRKESFSWGIIYYYKNDKTIEEGQYVKELLPYNIAL